ncbi:methyltransferase family protein [Sanguibacter keddieii DSM 10542]|uniref:Methyltransferase family protein n=1 Tax=Sanguibacter keddieii (strain ATCC 51767 / DSM 10542 / NCFB 3025 / ST-74) TaxID=446469 RepID=D1BDY4_SANKS|nr:class I SAM-dependent methyltransferase [Sanguibacter keddieii]ACZ23205.1 methyltransferase family protein [Sanguibacter keddieii DSM 10542]
MTTGPDAAQPADAPEADTPELPGAAAYGESMADVYDHIFPQSPDAEATAEFVVKLLKGTGSVLEMAVGTGRLALPMARRGLEVVGVDASPRMLEGLAEKDPDGLVTPVLGDFVDTDLGRTFDVSMLALNTLFILPDREDQIRTLANLRKHTADDGRVIIEAYDPIQYHALTEPKVVTYQLGPTGLMIDTVMAYPENQTVVIVHAILEDGGMRKTVEVSRYAWPSEIDLMARLAGLRLVARCGDWTGAPFSATSGRHISIYQPESPGR